MLSPFGPVPEDDVGPLFLVNLKSAFSSCAHEQNGCLLMSKVQSYIPNGDELYKKWIGFQICPKFKEEHLFLTYFVMGVSETSLQRKWTANVFHVSKKT